MSYRRLGERLAGAFAGHRDFAGEVLAHEAGLALLLHELIDAVGVHDLDEPFGLSDDRQDLLDRANVADAVGKSRAHRVMGLVRERLNAADLPAPAWPPEVGFSNGRPLLAASWDKGDGVIVGWQYQGRHRRLAMILSRDGLHGRGLHDAHAAFAREHVDFFDFSPMYEALTCTEADPRRSRLGPTDFNRYDPDFVYR